MQQRNIETAADMVLAVLQYRVTEKVRQLDEMIRQGPRDDIRRALRELDAARRAYAEFVAPASTSAEPTCYQS